MATQKRNEQCSERIVGASFGQKPPPLLKYIQNILNSYSDGQILKELTQNAEDAGASMVQLLYDVREFGTKRLYHDGLRPHQGPALYSYNDAVFTSEDWDGIQSPSDSGKRNNPLKVGRFGIGFVSVYHMTDVPSVLSGSYLAYMDPEENIFGPNETGFRFKLDDETHLRIVNKKDYCDQFEPYNNVFDDRTICSGEAMLQEENSDTKYFEGTLFRFPLRKEKSKISNNVYTTEKIHELLSTFEDDASLMLLFLKNLETIKLFTRKHDGRKSLQISTTLSEDTSDQVRTARRRMCDGIQDSLNNRLREDLAESYKMTISACSSSNRENKTNWFVCTYVGWPEDKDVLIASSENNLLAWVGVAMSLDSIKVKGRTFCFLPLPPDENSTCLPVHVNGAFAVSSDRRSVKWPSEDRTEDNSALWNQYLVGNVLPRAYAKLIVDVVTIQMEENRLVECVYKAWPDVTQPLGNWRKMVESMMNLLKSEKVFFTKACGGKWIDASEAVFDNACKQHSVYVHSALVNLLIRLDKPIVSAPDHVYEAVKQYIDANVAEVTPEYTRHCIRYLSLDDVGRKDKLLLLEYILQDKCYSDLEGIALLPLADKTFATFECPVDESCEIYITSKHYPIELFFNLKNKFIDENLKNSIQQTMEDIASLNKNRLRGLPQITKLNMDTVARLIRETLPMNWQRGQEVEWTPGQNQHPTKTWIEQCWNVLNNEFTQDLEVLLSLPLIPKQVNTKKIRMMLLKNDSCLISAFNPLTSRARPMDSKIEAVLEKIGLKVVHLPSYIGRHPQLYIEGFVRYPTLEGVVKALMALSKSEISRSLKQLFQSDKNTLRNFIIKILDSSFEMCLKERQCYSMLPIFKSFPDKDLVSAKNIYKLVKATELPDFATTEEMIGLYDRSDERLSSMLQLTTCSTDEALRQMLDNVSHIDMRELIKWIYKRWSNIESSDLLSKLKITSFLKTNDGSLKPPCDLFDPTDDVVSVLWDKDEGVFPVEDIDKKHIYILRELGLKNKQDITVNDVILRAKRIEAKGEKRKALSLFMLLSERPDLISTPLSNIKWVPVMCKPWTYPLTWGCVEKVAKPTEILSSEHIYIAGSSAALVELPKTNSVLKNIYWNELPCVSLVIKQLEVCITLWKKGKLDFKDPDEIKILCKIYTYLQESQDDVKKLLSKMPWIWQGSEFVEAQKISIQSIQMAPYVYTVPPVFAKFERLFLSCGAYRQMDRNAMLNIIHKVNDKHMKTNPTKEEIKYDQQFVVRIICNIFSDNEENDMNYEFLSNVLLPEDNNDRLRLYPVSEMCYCDMDGYEKENLHDDNQSSPVLLTHKDIPKELCKRLGVISLSKRLANAEEFEGIVQTGQSEDLTVRLRNILQGYEASDIPKELIQNADDAKATEVKFLIDFRENRNCEGKLLDPGMKRCQGPALWVQNNSTFSQEDFENIKKLGGQTKKASRNKIGRFGLGFNSVYHLTDVPSFISGDRIVFFDPHAIHLGNQIKDKTKLGITLLFTKGTRPKQLSLFKGQFGPYNGIFDCDLRPTSEWESYNGTLFRFPLRTDIQATDNKIRNEPYNKTKIKNILSQFHKNADDIILFTNHVKDVSLHLLHQYETNPQKTIELFRISTKQDGNLVTASMITSKRGKGFFGVDMSATKQWIVQSSDGRCEFKALARSEKVGDRLNLSDGHDAITELANSNFGVEHGLNPIGGVACPLGKNTAKGLVYCFLPLSVPLSRLPVYINASFSLSSNRRNLKKLGAGDEKSLDTQWNNAIMKHKITKIYINLLSKGECGNILSEDAAKKGDDFYFWPKNVHSDYTLIFQEFYRMVVNGDEHGLPIIFRKGGQWYDFRHLVLIDPELKHISNIGKSSMEILEILLDSEQTAVLDIPKWLYEILSSDHGIALKRQVVSKNQFFCEYFFPNIGKIGDEITDSILLHVLNADEYQDLLKSTACIPTKPDGKIRKRISELIYPSGSVSKMYSDEDNVFPFGDYSDSVIIQKLIRLGMQMEVLWSDIVERARTVEILQETSTEKAMARIRAIVKYTYHKHKIDKKEIEVFREDIKHIKFFPSMTKPKDYPISWFTHQMQLFPPKELYTEANADLVGSLHPIIDGMDFHYEILFPNVFGISKHPVIDDMFIQLEKVIKCDLNSKNIKAVKRIYMLILKKICQSQVHSYKDLVVKLKHTPIVLVNDHFVEGSRCARHEITGNIYDLLYEFPKDLENFWEFFRELGVLERFGVSDYIDAISRLNTKIQETESDAPIKPLEGNDIDAVMQILTHLEKELKEPSDADGVLIPDVENILRPVHELCYNDVSFVSPMENVKACNGKVSQEMAKRFGIKDIRTHTIINLSCDLFSGFGQYEQLTSRIKWILEGYPFGVSILREMLQNADDAGASKLSLILDNRTHPGSELPSTNWKHLQGPALCIYNDATFSDDDIRGIQDLGSGSKKEKSEKTGQYGVGFNVVYHVTDCPSFISNGETLCLFDPNIKYAPGATPDNPGLTTKKLQEVRRIFPKAMACYLNEFEHDFPQRGGTIFRLPLRSIEMIKLSKISNKRITTKEIVELLKEFEKEMPEILLFLKNVVQISIHEIDTSGKLFERYSVKSIIRNNDDKEKRQTFYLHTSEIDKVNKKDCSYQMEILCHKSNQKESSQRWLISQAFGFGGACFDAEFDLLSSHLPIGGVATMLPDNKTHQNFGHNSNNCSVHCFLPLPIKSGLPVIVNGHFCLGQSRRSIWDYDNEHNDPRAAWNYKLVTVVISRAYLNLLKEFATRTGLSEFLSNVMSDKDIKRRLDNYHRLFPNPSKTSSLSWKNLAVSLYKRIVDQDEPLLPILKLGNSDSESTTIFEIRWCSPLGTNFEKGYFYEVGVGEDKEKAMALKSLLIRLGMNVLYANFCIYYFFEAAGCHVDYVTPDLVCDFLSTNHGKCTLKKLPLPIHKTTMKTEGDLKTLMKFICTEPQGLHPHGLPIIITGDNSLNVCDCLDKSRKLESKPEEDFRSRICTFGNRKLFYCQYAKVFLKCKHEFLHKDYVNYYNISKFQFLLLTDIEERLDKHLNLIKYKNRSYIHYNSEILQPKWITDLWKCIFSSWKQNAPTDSSGNRLSPNPQELIRVFGDWAILPVRFKDEAYLIPLSMAATVKGDFAHDEPLCTIFDEKLKCPEPNSELLPEIQRIGALLSSPQHPEHIVSLLHFLQNNDEYCFTVLEPDDCAYLLNYFERNIKNLANKTFCLLKKLKLFETISGDIVSLSTTSDVVIIQENIPKDDQSKWISKTQNVFIKKQPQLENLYKKLGFGDGSSLEIYTKFILPYFCDFTDAGRNAHLRWILMKRLDERELNDIGFTSTPIMKTDTGFKRVNTLYDPEVELFQKMLPMHLFPPRPYDDPEWRHLLLNLGLISALSPAIFIQFGKMVENQILKNAEQCKENSEALVKALSDFQCDSSLLSNISTIKFIVPENYEVKTLFPGTHAVMFSGSVNFIHAHLVWTTKPVLPAYASIFKDQDAAELGVILEPNVEDVLRHLINISTSTETRLGSNDKNKIRRVFEDIYAFLSRLCSCNDASCNVCQCIVKLIPADLPFVLVHDDLDRSVLARASIVSERIPKAIKDVLTPYIYELPKEFKRYGNVFKAAGMTDEISVKQYSSVLETVFKSDNTGGRNPNFKNVVAACVQRIFEMLKHSEKEEIELAFESVDCLYFPDKEHMLISSCDLVYADVYRYERRINSSSVRLFIGFKELDMNESYFKYLDVLPHRLQLKIMSKEFREEMLVTECEECPDSKNGHCQFLYTYQTVLTSHEFRQGLIRLINHEKRHSDFDKETTEQKIENVFGLPIKLHCKKTITTQLYCINTLLNDSEGTAECCLIKSEQENELQNYELHVRHHEHPGSVAFKKTLVTIINDILGNEISDIMSLEGIVTIPSPFTINDTLDDLDITCCGSRPYEPILGNKVPQDSLYLLAQEPFDEFYQGEIVAYQLLDIDNESHYIYAKINHKISPSTVNRPTGTYAIDIGDKDEGPMEVSVLDIFKFLKPDRAIGLKLVHYEGNKFQSISYESLMDDNKKQIENKLQTIWRLPDLEKRKAIKRILLKWHPDKNEEDRKEFYTEMFQFIRDVIARLEGGVYEESSGPRYDENMTNMSFDDEFFDEINKRAKSDHTCFRMSEHVAAQPRPPQPDLSEARRWIRQAKIDLSAAETEDYNFCEWICFKCFQAAEKAFKAVRYAIDGGRYNEHSIITLAGDVKTYIDLTLAANRLRSAAGCQMSTRYPDKHPRDRIPNDAYSIDDAEKSKSAAREIVDGISEFLINTEINI